MDRDTARILLQSLLDRIDRHPDTGKRRLEGVISEIEWEALNFALDLLRAGDVPAPERQPEATTKAAAPRAPSQAAVELVRSAGCLELNAPDNPEVTLCLDFGTAMSKAFAISLDEGGSLTLLEVALGRRAGELGAVYSVTSALWIDDQGRIFFGREAVAKSLQHRSGSRKRLDSMKQQLSQGFARSLDEIPLETAVNPSGVPLTMGDALTLYLAYLTDLAATELSQRHGLSRYVQRNFALPCWPPDRRVWGEDLLRTLLARAQVTADVLSGRWAEGIVAGEAKEILDVVRDLPKLPDYLVRAGILEPIAAGSSRLRADRKTRGLVAVVDVGAGTSDFALFYVRRLEDGRWRAWPVQGTARAIRQAGDTIDNILRLALLDVARIRPDDPDFSFVDADLRLRIRELKERLFLNGQLTEPLQNDRVVTVTLADFLTRDDIKAFRDALRATLDDVLASAPPSFVERFGDAGLTVILTGGGATMSFVQELATGQSRVHDRQVRHAQAPLIPQVIEEDYPELAPEYPKLAVAIGGASPDLLEEMPELAEVLGTAVQKWQIGGYYTKGV